MTHLRLIVFACLTLGLVAGPAAAQTAQQPPTEDPDLQTSLAQPDFTVIGTPTTLRLPKFKSAFRVTHRFARPLNDGGFGSLAADFFGLDAGAQIGLEYRFGLLRGLQVGVHRTSDRTVQLFAQHEVKAQTATFPVDLQVLVAVDGTNNMKDSYSPSIGAVISREWGDRLAVYLQPIWVNNTNTLPSALVDDNDTVAIGFATRLRVRPRVYVLLEAMPRVRGYEPGSTYVAFGIERRSGGHSFQLSVANGFGSTLPQIARGGTGTDHWYLGFSISRKFY